MPEGYIQFFQALSVRYLMLCTILLYGKDFFTCHHKITFLGKGSKLCYTLQYAFLRRLTEQYSEAHINRVSVLNRSTIPSFDS